MKVLIAGGSGFLGTALRTSLVEDRHDVFILTRRSSGHPGEIQWDGKTTEVVFPSHWISPGCPEERRVKMKTSWRSSTREVLRAVPRKPDPPAINTFICSPRD